MEMFNYHFAVCDGLKEKSVYIKASSYDEAIDSLFKDYHFDNYEFRGIIQY